MGPRNRRRLRNAAIAAVAVLVVVIGAVVLLAGSPGSSGQGASDAGTATQPVHQTEMIAYGMSKQQVRRLAGQPNKTQGACWLYQSKPLSLVQLPPPGETASDEGLAPLKVCFADSTTQWLYHWGYDKRLHKNVWIPPVTFSLAH